MESDLNGRRIRRAAHWLHRLGLRLPLPADLGPRLCRLSVVPLHARDVVAAEGFSDFDARPLRLRLLLDAYGYIGPVRPVLEAVRARIAAHAQDVRDIAAGGDLLVARLLESRVVDSLHRAITELESDQRLWALD